MERAFLLAGVVRLGVSVMESGVIGVLVINKLLLMEPSKILVADVLDIVFEGRNKEYGAYELRRSYNRRLVKAIMITSGILLVFFVSCSIMGRGQGEKVRLEVDATVDLKAVDQAHVDPPPPVVPKPVVPIKTDVFTPPLLEKDPPENQRPPEQDALDSVRIGTTKVDGSNDVGETPAPVGNGNNVVEAPKKVDEDPQFLPVEFEAQFPGGMQAWARFMNRNLHYPEEAVNIDVSGQVVVQFVVDKDGNVSDVQAISGPDKGGLREEAVRVIKRSGKWTPGNQNGQPVKSYKRQPVTFVLGNE